MILQEIINSFVWTPYGVQCPSVEKAQVAHKFLREAILDRHLCVCKVIGFQIKSHVSERPHVGTYIARHPQIAESYPEIMVNLLDKVFLTTQNKELTCEIERGVNTVNTVKFSDGTSDTITPMATSPDICRVIDKSCQLKLKTVYDCGYRSNQQNSKKIGENYFPCYTDFYVGDFYRILPPEPGETIVKIRYYNGGTQENLRLLLTYYLNAIQTGNIRKEERKWLQNFMR